MKLTTISTERLTQIVSRLLFHFPVEGKEAQKLIFSNFMDKLSHYPEDLVCAAYQHILSHRATYTVPSPEDFITIMEPELQYRQLHLLGETA
jgi:hypothetical protein